MGNSPIPKKRCAENNNSPWVQNKIQRVTQNLKQKLGVKYTKTDETVHDFTLMVIQMRAIFHTPGTEYEKKIELLAMLPQTWSIPRMAKSMGSSHHMAKVAKKFASSGRMVQTLKRKGKDN